MEIVWLGHACFRLRSGDVTVITDPFPEEIGLTMGTPQARVVTVSHEHPHHSYVAGVGGEPYVARGPGEYELQGVYLRGLRTPPGPNDPPGKRNTAFVIDMDGVSLCHLGGLSRPLPGAIIEALGTINVLFVPAGGAGTLPLNEVGTLVSAIAPRLVVPMQYAIPGLTVALAPLDAFLQELGAKGVEPVSRLVVTPNNLPPETRVVVLEPQGQSRS